MKKTFLMILMILGTISIQAQTFSSTTSTDLFGNVITVYIDEFGFEIGSKIETEDLFGNVQTTYEDEFGFEVGTSTGYYDLSGKLVTDFDFDTYTEPQLNLDLPSFDLILPVFDPFNPN